VNALHSIEAIAEAAPFVPSKVFPVCCHRWIVGSRHNLDFSKALWTTERLIAQTQTIDHRDGLPAECAILACAVPLPDFHLNHSSHFLFQLAFRSTRSG
jgi:hypothetical protein